MTDQQLNTIISLATVGLLFLPSLIVALTPHPDAVESTFWRVVLLVLGRLSMPRHGVDPGDSPGTLHFPLTAQPPPRAPALYLRSEIQPQPTVTLGSGPPLARRFRVTPAVTWLRPAAAAILVVVLLPACASTPIDKARVAYSHALQVAMATNARFREQSRDFQEQNIRRIGPHTPAAVAWQSAFVVKRQPVIDQIRRCDEILSNANDLLLLSDDVRGIPEAKNATACVGSLRDMIAKFFDGGM